eukprot:749761-Hanusia_phi.AAC.2
MRVDMHEEMRAAEQDIGMRKAFFYCSQARRPPIHQDRQFPLGLPQPIPQRRPPQMFPHVQRVVRCLRVFIFGELCKYPLLPAPVSHAGSKGSITCSDGNVDPLGELTFHDHQVPREPSPRPARVRPQQAGSASDTCL